MRMYALLTEPIGKIRKVMIYESKNGVYVFLFDSHEDKGCYADHWFVEIEDAMDYCMEELNINESQWVCINDPQDGDQHDIIGTIRINNLN
ncbi:hypothetical protein [Cohnella phaseoli]|uniref:Uncharacterized protein n=1 Tax=Cohnella phaseoli TaxID=456490 RepID=A0A3D9JNQ2_9BACL|nr:hypothetical protein [Cohnella phaseoli]RED75713.1 hypothetical protein DFP98_11474 [Cohnella phaseoli]